MVKFLKQFEAQLIPEWKDAFVDYRQLKKELKKIYVLDSKDKNQNNPSTAFKHTSLSAILVSSLKKLSQLGKKHREHGPIQVHRKLTSLASKGEMYETELLEQFTHVEAAGEFFKLLDFQLNKVNQFYKGKEKEFLERGELLDKQMEFLIQLKTVVGGLWKTGIQKKNLSPPILLSHVQEAALRACPSSLWKTEITSNE